MPRQQLMSWETGPAFRWVKMYKGTRYRVSCDELKTARTKEASIAAANNWWIKKRAEIDGAKPKSDEEQIIESLMGIVAGSPTVQQTVEGVLALAGKPAPAIIPSRGVKANVEGFLALAKGEIRPLSFMDLRKGVESLIAPGGI